MPKRSPDGAAAGRAAKRSRRRRFLYLVMDDWELGYSIRKVDLEEEYDDDAYTDEAGTFSCNSSERRLPPVVFRLEAPHIGPYHFAAAFGTKIIALHHTPRRYIPVFDVRTRCLSFGPRMRRNPSAPIYVPISDKLFSLDFGTFQMLHPPPPPINPNCSITVPKWPSWRRLPTPPFKHERVTSHAVHPDGRTIFISISHKTGATFAFDTAASSPKWTRTGNWQLPFKGRAHYDCELDAWVGLTKDPDTLGHLCSCDIPSTDDSVGRQALAWKLSKDKLFCKNPEEHHVGAALVYLGEGFRSKFCLLQCLSIDDREDSMYKEYLPERERYVLRLTTFSLKYDKNGDLRTTARRGVRSFEFPKALTECSDFLMNPMAFWM